jgi:alpha-D-xyloside xylohydrolase
MKPRPMPIRAIAVAMFTSAFAIATSTLAEPVSLVTQTPSGLSVETSKGFITIEPWSDRDIRIRVSAKSDWKGTYNPAVIAKPALTSWKVAETKDGWTLTTKVVQVRISKADGALSVLAASDQTVVGQRVLGMPGDSSMVEADGAVSQVFAFGGGAIYGLGQHQNGMMDYTGTTIRLLQSNSDVAVPMLVSSNGFGILWNNASVTEVDAALPQDDRHVKVRSEAGGGIDYHLLYGPELDQVIAEYRTLTGNAPLMARWTWGLWQSKERYKTQDELVSIAAHYRQMQVPLDAVVQDWQYWAKGDWGDHVMEAARFPEPKKMLQTLHNENVHAIVSVWARFDLGTDNLAELDKIGAVFPATYKNIWPVGEGRWYDPYNAKGRDLYWRQIMKTLGTAGFDGWWLDGSEIELGGHWGELRELQTAAGSGRDVINAAPLMHTTGVFEGMRRDIPDKRAYILTRSAYSGQQRNAAVTWSGDTTGTWDVFRRQIPAALNFSLSGIPYWSADIGGFFGGKPSDPAYAELYTRWYQFAVFNPMFRVHGTGAGKEIWQFDAATQGNLIDYTRLRYRLLPYIYSASWDVTHNQGTMMRPLAMDFRADKSVLAITDQYMFGKSLLVAPVIQSTAQARTVYLPEGEIWFDFWTGMSLKGGQVVVAKADIKTIPLFVRSGSILPLGPVVQYADQKSQEPIELRVYPGKDGEYQLYDDAGDGYGYEKGQFTTVNFKWNNAKRSLEIGARQGKFPGMETKQGFKIVCAVSGSPVTASANYSGAKMTIDLSGCV